MVYGKLIVFIVVLGVLSISIMSTASSQCDSKTVYAAVKSRLTEISALEGIAGILGWDEMVLLPEEASAVRGTQKEVLTGILFDKRSDTTYGEQLKLLHESASNLTDVEKANVRLAYNEYIRLVRLPKEMVQRQSALETEGYNAWIEARTKKDFSIFEPCLTEWVILKKEEARLIDDKAPTYDTLLYTFEKGMTATRLDEIFVEVKKGLIPLIKRIRESKSPPVIGQLTGSFDTSKQAKLCKEIALDLGFNEKCGRLDVSVHPFTGGAHPTDVRMTTRFKENDVTEGLTGAIHETGHAIYEQGRNLNDDYKDLPVSSALSMGVHESQSLLWERMVALSKPFQEYLLPKLQTYFPENEILQELTPTSLYSAMNIVKNPSKIRVEADEVTYTLHVILRYEIEKGLLDGTIAVKDVPKLWNDKMAEYLGEESRPEHDAEGCLQDVHWSGGALGYFPTYSLGAMFAVQIFNTAKKDMPDMERDLAAGKFAPLKAWLNERVHKLGSFPVSGDDLMQTVTGSKLDPSVYLGYLEDKYTGIYNL